MKVRVVIGIIFLLMQVGSIAYARFIPERFFCWAPYDEHTRFQVYVTIDDSELTTEEVVARYKYKMSGWEQRSIHNIMSLISQYERTYGKEDDAKVTMIYSRNGHKEEQWIYQNE